MRSRLLLLTTALAALPAFAVAQPATELDQVVVATSRVGIAEARSPYSVSVLSAEQIAAQPSVADALGAVGDIHVQAPGGRAGTASIFLRGADPNFTVVLLDGVALNNSTNSRGGSVNVSEIGAAGLERIEIVAGPLSSLYGSGSLAGVVNLIVPGGGDTHALQVMAGAGTRGLWSGAARWRGPLAGGLGASLGLVVDDEGEQTQGSAFRSAALTGKIAPLGEDNAGRLILRLSESDAETFPDSSGGSRLAAIRVTEHRDSREQLLGLSVPVFRQDAFRIDLSASYLNRRDNTVTPGVAPSAVDPFGIPAGIDASRYRRTSAQVSARVERSHWTTVAGIEGLREEGRSEGSLDFGGFLAPASFDQDRTTWSAFAETGHTGPALSLNAGVRLDDVEGLGQRLTARAGANYPITENWSARGAIGSGFKAPSFYALGNPFVGNPGLDPERSLGGEIGLTWRGDGVDQFTLTAFRTRFKGLIDFVPGPPPRLENRNLVISEGISASLGRQITPQLTGAVQGLYAETTDEATGRQLLNRPRWRLTASLTWSPNEALSLTARSVHVGKRDDYATPVGVETLRAYNTLALEAAWRFMPATTARLAIDNALDENFESAVGFATPGARARLFLTHTF
jgi:vitamin B12 transporter